MSQTLYEFSSGLRRFKRIKHDFYLLSINFKISICFCIQYLNQFITFCIWKSSETLNIKFLPENNLKLKSKGSKKCLRIKTTTSYFSLEIFHFEHEKVQIFLFGFAIHNFSCCIFSHLFNVSSSFKILHSRIELSRNCFVLFCFYFRP